MVILVIVGCVLDRTTRKDEKEEQLKIKVNNFIAKKSEPTPEVEEVKDDSLTPTLTPSAILAQ